MANVFKQIGDAVTGILKGFSGEKAAEEKNAMTVELANTAHQREVADLKAAGLNPALSAGGSGADTPVLDTPGNKAAAALELMKTMSDIRAQNQNTKLQANQVKQIQNDITNNNKITDAEVNLKNAQTGLTDTQNKIESWKANLGEKGNNLLNDIFNSFGKGNAISIQKNTENIKKAFSNLPKEQQEILTEELQKKMPLLNNKFGSIISWMLANKNRSGS